MKVKKKNVEDDIFQKCIEVSYSRQEIGNSDINCL